MLSYLTMWAWLALCGYAPLLLVLAYITVNQDRDQ